MIFGNQNSQAQFQTFLQNDQRTITLTGPSHLGKSSFVQEILKYNVHPSDYIIMDSGVDGAREMIQFCNSSPLGGDFRYVLVDDSTNLSEPAQDALLKVTEEPNSSTKIIMIAHDVGLLQPALKSRIREINKWYPLSHEEMTKYAESVSSVVFDPLVKISSGIPGIYKVMLETPGFEDFYNFACSIADGSTKPFLSSIPSIIKDLKSGPSIIRDSVVHVLKLASRNAKDTHHSLELLHLCRTLSHSLSANPEIHWIRMSANLSNVK